MWAAAKAVGIPNEEYWEMTGEELEAVMKAVAMRDRAANLRAGLVAATIVNMSPHRRHRRVVKPSDFIAKPRVYMTPEEGQAFMKRWAGRQNAKRSSA